MSSEKYGHLSISVCRWEDTCALHMGFFLRMKYFWIHDSLLKYIELRIPVKTRVACYGKKSKVVSRSVRATTSSCCSNTAPQPVSQVTLRHEGRFCGS